MQLFPGMKFIFVLLLELYLAALHEQASVFYIKRIEAPTIREVGKVESKRSEEPRTESQDFDETASDETSFTRKNRTEGTRRGVTIKYERSKVPHSGGILRYDRKSDKSGDAAELSWPAGTYGLPKPRAGCPSSSGFEWQSGYRFHDTEDDGTENQHSDSFHLAGSFSDDGIRHEFCMKTDSVGGKSWPEGQYCIYKKGDQCPGTLEEGFVIWDDENKDNQDDAGGVKPDGLYTEDTKVFFCCSTAGSASKPIRLPNDRPFFLFAYSSIVCQKVHGMKVAQEFVKFDDEDRGNVDYEGGEFPYGIHKGEKDHMIFLCYYTPEHQPEFATLAEKPVNVPPPRKPKKKYHTKKGTKKKVDKLEELEKLRNSEKMMDAFLASTSKHNIETNKNERAKTIIKTIRVPERDSTTSVVVTTAGVVLGIVLLGSMLGIFVLRQIKMRQEGMDSIDDAVYTGSSQSRSYTTDDELTEADFEDELVEDQYLPSDSELKTGLELMFLKQQRHYWTRKKRP